MARATSIQLYSRFQIDETGDPAYCGCWYVPCPDDDPRIADLEALNLGRAAGEDGIPTRSFFFADELEEQREAAERATGCIAEIDEEWPYTEKTPLDRLEERKRAVEIEIEEWRPGQERRTDESIDEFTTRYSAWNAQWDALFAELRSLDAEIAERTPLPFEAAVELVRIAVENEAARFEQLGVSFPSGPDAPAAYRQAQALRRLAEKLDVIAELDRELAEARS